MAKQHLTIGWREWIGLPDLGVDYIKAKIDTGARTSALHVNHIEVLEEREKDTLLRVRIHPVQRSRKEEITAEVFAHDQRTVKSSAGHQQHRYVIETNLKAGERIFPIEISLTNRDAMGFRMLLGRTALRKDFLINPKKSYLLGKPDFARRKGTDR